MLSNAQPFKAQSISHSPTSNPFAGLWTSLPIPLTKWVLDVVYSMGYTQMTPVQASTIPLFMKHKDVVVEAVTGSGKTLAFVIPVLERLIRRESRLKRDEIGALVIAPTRELASQIHSVFALFYTSQPQSQGSEPLYPEPLLLISSDRSSPAQDVQRFLSTGSDVVVGTPGRIEEFLLGKGRLSVNVKELEVLIMDEADRLLDLGFQTTLSRIITHLPKQRRTGLFSATMTDTDNLSELVRVGLRNPARIVVQVHAKKNIKSGLLTGTSTQVIEEKRTPAGLQNYYINCRFSEKLVQLVRILSYETTEKSASHFMIYFATCACVDYFFEILPGVTNMKATFYSLHGNLPPSARTRTLEKFTLSLPSPSEPSILLATDVAARGLDLPNVDVVIQFDAPTDTKTFSHRCGRTARAGRQGTAWTLLSGREVEFCDFLAVRKIPIKEWPYLVGASNKHDVIEDQDVGTYLDKIRGKLRTDRALHDQSTKAFVSFVRAYSKHEASYIFRVKDLDMVGLARCYGLLRLPRMPELKTASRECWEDAPITWEAFAYADAAREVKRAAVTNKMDDSNQEPSKKEHKKGRNAAWSTQKERREGRQKRQEKKSLKKSWLMSQKASSTTGHDMNSGKRGRSDEIDGDDATELAREEKMAKRLRKGEISQVEFDAEFGTLEKWPM